MSIDTDRIAVVRARFIDGDRAGDAELMAPTLADDIVILHPQSGLIEGKTAAMAFVRQVLGEVRHEFDKQVSHTTIELHVSGELAFERGDFEQMLVPRAGGPALREHGQYLWVYMKGSDENWRIARIVGMLWHDEGERVCDPIR